MEPSDIRVLWVKDKSLIWVYYDKLANLVSAEIKSVINDIISDFGVNVIVFWIKQLIWYIVGNNSLIMPDWILSCDAICHYFLLNLKSCNISILSCFVNYSNWFRGYLLRSQDHVSAIKIKYCHTSYAIFGNINVQ